MTISLPSPASSTPCWADTLPASDFFTWRETLLRKGGEDGALDWLLDAAAGLPRSQLPSLLLDPSRRVHLACSRRKLEALWQQHLNESVPLQYLVGRCYWRDFELDVGPAVLIPRPETEAMIDLGVGLLRRMPPIPRTPGQEVLWADLGTGSGCLAMGLAQELPKSWGLAVDVSALALDQARRNLKRAGFDKRVVPLQGEWFAAAKPWWGRLQLVLTNPPYIPSAELELLDPIVRDHEPHLALNGGTDGLVSIRRLIQQAQEALSPGGWLVLEHHHDQSDAVLGLLASAGLVDGQSHQDLEGNRRFASARRSSEHP